MASTHPAPTKVARLHRIGASLTTALGLASPSTPGTVGHRAAWRHADEAIAGIGHEITLLESLEPVLVAARRDHRRAPREHPDEEARALTPALRLS